MCGRSAEAAISVSVCTPSSANTIKIAVTLLVTDRPASVEFPATARTLISVETRFAFKGGNAPHSLPAV